MKIYTRTGDDGTTGLFGGARLRKSAARIEAYGTLDELNAVLGLCRAEALPADLDGALARVQAELFVLGAELASTPDAAARGAAGELGEDAVARLEREIDGFEQGLAPLASFILPGGTQAGAALHHARTVCRRAERLVVGLSAIEPVRREAVTYLNRLSDHLFVMARLANRRAGVADVPWRPRG